jgi:hypothetical protein
MFSVQTLAPHIPQDYGEFLTPTPHADQAEFFDQLHSENLHLTYWKFEKDLSDNRGRMREPARSLYRLSNSPSSAANIKLSRRLMTNLRDFPGCVLFTFVRFAEIS